jgi:DNA-binding response OmpR family regulator
MTDNKYSNYSLVDKKVLIIEDDAFLGGIILQHMLDDKIKARLVSSGDNAIEAIKLDIPDVLILDIMLPGINGVELLEMIRKDPLLKNISIIVVSNSDLSKDMEKVKNFGAKYLMKALVTPTNIVEEIRKSLNETRTGTRTT